MDLEKVQNFFGDESETVNRTIPISLAIIIGYTIETAKENDPLGQNKTEPVLVAMGMLIRVTIEACAKMKSDIDRLTEQLAALTIKIAKMENGKEELKK